ncbi:unnamed protein product [Aspergillus oryzae]|uniref:Unnamed protein product n=2 Tax=Aspergillus oryzae TaxID=5062 RepID=A0AAN4YV02_ASPOZ|nr:unnamed protein product [Aspergillus oryzae]GMF97369.1 unnamed protein product [Aspergillus oryzae]GMG09268.1 unnamed protein product [Aspergillus oryzae]GMG34613.1 unnamed protein product [Aspergillus oryzae]GMG55410.1 unnamed protein product [Aspergillus oryzae var. brunneus]
MSCFDRAEAVSLITYALHCSDPLFILGATNPKQHSSQENKSSANSDSVTISNSEYQGLVSTVKKAFTSPDSKGRDSAS